jgi:hypothetical protein
MDEYSVHLFTPTFIPTKSIIMKRFRLWYIPLFALITLFTSCIDIIENLLLNKDGSGKYELTMDMSRLLADPMMKGLMEASEDKDKMKDMDSVIYFKDMPDSIKKDNPDLWNRVRMQIYSNAEKEKLYTKVYLDFKSVDEIGYLSKNLGKFMSNSKADPLAGEGGSIPSTSAFISENLQYLFSGKELTRVSGDTEMPADKKEDLEMMKTFLGDASYKLTYELPGKVKKVTIPNAKIDGKKVTSEASFMDLLEGKVSLDGSIKYK